MQSDVVSREDAARFGVAPEWTFAIRHRVRWSECDPFGHANHRAYFEWFEEARNRYLEAVGLAPLSPNTPGPVIANTGIRYHRPLASSRANPVSSLEHRYEPYRHRHLRQPQGGSDQPRRCAVPVRAR
jgi:hypothetical protein